LHDQNTVAAWQKMLASKYLQAKYLQAEHLQGCLIAQANLPCISGMMEVLLEMQAGHQHGLCSWQSS